MELYRCRLSLHVIEAKRSSSCESEPSNSPAMVEAFPYGRQPAEVTLPGLLDRVPVGGGNRRETKAFHETFCLIFRHRRRAQHSAPRIEALCKGIHPV